MTTDELRSFLFTFRDEKYGDFISKLIPELPREHFIGIRTPEYKKILRAVKDDPVIPVFTEELPHVYHEENCLHAALINGIKDFDACADALEGFMPYMDCWAITDSIAPACFAKHKTELLPRVQRWIASEHTFTCRCGMHVLMANYLDNDFEPEILSRCADINTEAYYVNMMTAWLFAEALTKHWDETLPYITQGRLPVWVHNKAIQKARESYRISDERKVYLKSLKRKA